MAAYSIGVDLGGTNLRVAAVDADGQLLARLSEHVDYKIGPDHVVAEIVRLINAVRSQVVNLSVWQGVGLGVPGFINMDSGVVEGAANLPGFQNFPVRDQIQNALGIPIILENDANAAALGEMWIGAGTHVRNLMLITLGTGIGGGIVVDGKVLHGCCGMAGEIGHMTVFPDGNPCGCGNYGCLEKHASATAIAAMGRMMHFGDNVTAKDVYDLAAAGNRNARLVFEAMGRALGIALASAINIFNFPLYLLSGGPLPAWDFFAPTMFAEIERRSFTWSRKTTRVERGLLGADAGLFGAAYLPFQHAAVLEKSAGVL